MLLILGAVGERGSPRSEMISGAERGFPPRFRFNLQTSVLCRRDDDQTHQPQYTPTMKTVAALTVLAGSAAAFAPAPVTRVESSLGYASELDSMTGIGPETGNKVVGLSLRI